MTSTIYTHTRFAEDIGRDQLVIVPPVAAYSPQGARAMEDDLIEKMKGMKRPDNKPISYKAQPRDFNERRKVVLAALAEKEMTTAQISKLIRLTRTSTHRYLEKLIEEGLIEHEERKIRGNGCMPRVWYWSLTEAAQ